MLPSNFELLQKAKIAFAKNDRATFEKAIYQILSSDIECDEAWNLLYQRHGKGRPYKEFKSHFTQKYFSGQNLPQRQASASEHIPTKPTHQYPQANTDTANYIKTKIISAANHSASESSGEMLYRCQYCNLPFKSNNEVQSHITRWHEQAKPKQRIERQQETPKVNQTDTQLQFKQTPVKKLEEHLIVLWLE